MTHLTEVSLVIHVDPDEHLPVQWRQCRPYRISGLLVTYRRDSAGDWTNFTPGTQGNFLDNYTGPVDRDDSYTLPAWAQQLVADHTPGTVTDDMLAAALDSLSPSYDVTTPDELRAALAAALAAQVGEPNA